MKVSAVFDIGKTNKKFFLFDKNYQEIFKEYARFDPITDEDGHECEDLQALENWMKSLFLQVLGNKEFKVRSLNFSAYGASFVHVGKQGKPVAPLYNYLKPAPDHLFDSFYKKYGGKLKLCRQTASPALGFLNSGLQLYWLKYERPEIYNKVRWAMHLPQYLSYLFTGNPTSDYTSVGCHTTLWNFEQNDYHQWVYQEGFEKLLPPLVKTNSVVRRQLKHHKIDIGVGIHDSSSALLPYLRANHKPFLLLSTGTWSIALNGFSKGHLTNDDLLNDCLNYMRINGEPVKACRLFLGNEYSTQVNHLQRYFNKDHGYHRSVRFHEELYERLKVSFRRSFKLEHIARGSLQLVKTELAHFESFEEALHQLMLELVELQVHCLKRAIGDTEIQKIYIDGGFADNDLYVNMLADQLPGYKLRTTRSPLGSALGATMVISQPALNTKFLRKNMH